jgi:hypothetical protein
MDANVSTQKNALVSNDMRRAPRSRCLREGRCVFNKGFSDLNVLVRNMSSTGAKLAGDELHCLPEEFELRVHNGFGAFTSYWVKRAWAKADTIGVAFIDPVGERNSAPHNPGRQSPNSARSSQGGKGP